MACYRVKCTLILLVTLHLTYYFQAVSTFQALPPQPYTHFSSVSTVLLAAPLYPPLFDHVNNSRRAVQLCSFTLPNFMQFTIPTSQLGPSTFLSILLSNNLSVLQSLDCRGWCSPSRRHLHCQPKYQ